MTIPRPMVIAHLADIQVRAHSRHQEFEESFQHLYRYLRAQKPDRIVLAGDIVHNKTNISPELVHIVSNFLRELASIANVDLILGNHDLAMKNMERMDALSPIVDALDNPGINFYRESGVYGFAPGYQYVVMSCLDDEKIWRKTIAQANPDKILIGLWHGTVNGALLDNGTTLESPHNLSMFEGLDYVMLGDIHKTQIVDKARRIAYPGSYPKQNYGEDLQGGYFRWRIESKTESTLEFQALPTVCPFYTLDIAEKGDAWESHYKGLQRGARIRIRTQRALNAAEKQELTECVSDLYEPSEVCFVSIDKAGSEAVVVNKQVQVGDLRIEAVQEKLLKDYLAPQGLTEAQVQQLIAINKECPVSHPDTVRNVRYKIEKFGFGGMFSFGKGPGDGHQVDLTKHKGIVGIFGKNAAGKSSLVVDVPLYTLFNKISKDVSKNQHYVNDRLDSCASAMDLRIGDELHFISRWTKIKRTKKRSGAIEESSVTDCSYKTPTKSLLGVDRAETDKQIRQVFGSAEDFMLTSVASQFDLLGFVANKATDRKKTIARYFDLEVFEEKHKQANDTLRGLKKQLQLYLTEGYDECIAKAQEEVAELNRRFEEVDKQAKSARRLYEFGRQKIETLRLELERDESARKVSGAEVKARYIQTRDEVQRLRDELNEYDAYSCLDEPKCCLASAHKAAQERLESAERRFEEVKQQMTALVEQINRAAARAAPGKEKIREQERVCAECHQEERKAATEVHELTRQITRKEQLIEGWQKAQKQVEAIRERYAMQELYVKAMSKDGLSYEIIKQNLGRINDQISEILGTELHFDVWLEDDDKEIIVYLQNQGQKPRLIELCSGMEKTVAAIAIRAALIAVTTLPVSNVFILDESFTSLDVEHMDAIGRVLQGLKRLFATIFLICHNDYVKDLCDSIIMVDVDEEGFSRVNAA